MGFSNSAEESELLKLSNPWKLQRPESLRARPAKFSGLENSPNVDWDDSVSYGSDRLKKKKKKKTGLIGKSNDAVFSIFV